MALAQFWIVTFLSFVALTSAYQSFYEDFIDPYNADDTFQVDCGTSATKKMRIVFRGNAYRVYAPHSPGCEAVEVEPAHFEITNAMDASSLCDVMEPEATLAVTSLELVVQKGPVRSHDDMTYLVSCNYELGGQERTGFKNTGLEHVAKQGFLVQANNETAQSTVTLSIRDVHNKDITTSKMGSYIQLVAFMDAQNSEVSFRMWNCRAFSNYTGIYAEHYILLEGCGDGKVIKQDRGFRTYAIVDTSGETIRTARSVFFRTFALLGNNKLKFECDYIVRPDASTDGASCKRAPAYNAGRRKRSADLAIDERQKRSIVFELDLPSTESAELDIEPEEVDLADNVITYHLRKDNEDQSPETMDKTYEPADIAAATDKSQDVRNIRPEIRSRVNAFQPANVGDAYNAQLPDVTSVLKSPVVIGLMVTCVILLLLPVVMVCYMLVKRNNDKHIAAHPPRYVAPPVYIPDTPLLENVDLKLLNR